MKKENSGIKILLIFMLSVITIILLFVDLAFFIIGGLTPIIYVEPKDYQKCLEENYFKEDIAHFPKIIPAEAQEVRLYCKPSAYDLDDELVLLRYKTDKNHIKSELKKYEFINPDEPIGTPQKIYNMHPEFAGISPRVLTYYVIKNLDNERVQRAGFFPYYSGIGVSKDMDYILYYAVRPGD